MRLDGYLDIILKEKIPITNMSHMFCRGIDNDDRMTLLSIPNISQWDTKNTIIIEFILIFLLIYKNKCEEGVIKRIIILLI